MRLTQLERENNKIYILKRHKGFVRYALKHGIKLVPVFIFGEELIYNIVRIPFIQAFFYKYFRVFFPQIHYGYVKLSIFMSSLQIFSPFLLAGAGVVVVDGVLL